MPTVFENYIVHVEFEGHPIKLNLWDTAGQEDYDKLRPLGYSDSDLVFICFAIDSPDSLVNTQAKVSSMKATESKGQLY